MHYISTVRVLIICVCAAACASACGDAAQATLATAAPTVSQPIVGGRPTGSDFAAVGVMTVTNRLGQPQSICSATLIAPDVAVTAAHCIGAHRLATSQHKVWFFNGDDAAQFARTNPVRVATRIMHPDYDDDAPLVVPLAWRTAQSADEHLTIANLEAVCGAKRDRAADVDYWQCMRGLDVPMQAALGLMDGATNAADIAILILQTPIDAAPFAVLPQVDTEQPTSGRQMRAVGFGSTDAHSSVHSRGRRHQGTLALDGVGAHELQVGFSSSKVSFGDSGGPLFLAEDPTYTLIGIASRSLVAPDGRCLGPTLYAKTSAYLPWIQATLTAACQSGVRSKAMCRSHPL